MGQARQRGTKEDRIAQAMAVGRIKPADTCAERNAHIRQISLCMTLIAALVKAAPDNKLVVPGLVDVGLNPPVSGLRIHMSEDKDTATITFNNPDDQEAEPA